MTVTAPALDTLAEGYRRDGFCVLSGALSPVELQLLQEETAAQIAAGPEREPRTDFMTRRTTAGGDLFYRIQTLHDRPLRNPSVLWLMANPTILGLVARIVPDPLCYGNALVFKGTEGGPPIEVHRDARPTAEGHRTGIVSVDVYLDAATPDTGCLGVVPGSHLQPDVSELVAGGFDTPLVDVVLEPGDVLLHDGMVVHGSRATPPGRPMRRVVYPTFQSASRVVAEGLYPDLPVPRAFVAECLALQLLAGQARAADAPYDEVPFSLPIPADLAREVREVRDHCGDATTWRPLAGNLPWETGQMHQQALAAPPIDLAVVG